MSIQLSLRTSSWLYVAGGAAVGVVAWRAVARRKQQRLAQADPSSKRSSGARTGATGRAPDAHHRSLGGASSQLPRSVQSLVGGLSQPSAAADTHENGPLHEGYATRTEASPRDIGPLFHPESSRASGAGTESERDIEAVSTGAIGSAGPEPVFELQRVTGSSHPVAGNNVDDASNPPQTALFPEAELAARREGASGRGIPEE